MKKQIKKNFYYKAKRDALRDIRKTLKIEKIEPQEAKIYLRLTTNRYQLFN